MSPSAPFARQRQRQFTFGLVALALVGLLFVTVVVGAIVDPPIDGTAVTQRPPTIAGAPGSLAYRDKLSGSDQQTLAAVDWMREVDLCGVVDKGAVEAEWGKPVSVGPGNDVGTCEFTFAATKAAGSSRGIGLPNVLTAQLGVGSVSSKHGGLQRNQGCSEFVQSQLPGIARA